MSESEINHFVKPMFQFFMWHIFYYYYFNNFCQVLEGLPLLADLDMGYHSVVIVATDSKGLGARNSINLHVNNSAFVHFTHR